jgi:hypothetical protein
VSVFFGAFLDCISEQRNLQMNVSACGAAFIGGTTSTRSLKQQS